MVNNLKFGVGQYQKGKWLGWFEGKHTYEYVLWSNMLKRCYSEKSLARQPTYENCIVSENFKNFQYFAEWCNNQIGFNTINYHLDKDIVFKGNKLYSENTCFFIPKGLNSFLIRSDGSRGKYPIGVCYHSANGTYRSRCRDNNGKNIHLGLCKTPEEAFQVYKVYKEALAKELSQKYKGQVHPMVIDALNNYTVDITD